MKSTFANINGTILNKIILANFYGSSHENNSLLANYNGDTAFPMATINTITNFLRTTLKPTHVDLINNITIENNGKNYTLDVYPAYNDSLILNQSQRTVNITNPNNNTILVFTQLDNDFRDFSGITNQIEHIKTAFYIKIFKIVDDELIIPDKLNKITLTIPASKIGLNIEKIQVQKFSENENTSSMLLIRNINNDFIFEIDSTSTYVISQYYDWLLPTVNMDRDIQIYALPPQGAPNSYYHTVIDANLYELFDNYSYKQIDIVNVAINFTYDEDQLNKIFDNTSISDPGKFGKLQQGLLGQGKKGRENGSINGSEANNTNLNLRLLEMVAIHLFGHAKARAAIRNDSNFTRLSPIIKQGVLEKFDGEVKNRFFQQYVGSGKYVNSNDTEKFVPFNLDNSSIRYQIEFTVDNIFDSTGTQLTQITPENHMWHTNIALDFVHNKDMPRFN
jgi:hypothetical protein